MARPTHSLFSLSTRFGSHRWTVPGVRPAISGWVHRILVITEYFALICYATWWSYFPRSVVTGPRLCRRRGCTACVLHPTNTLIIPIVFFGVGGREIHLWACLCSVSHSFQLGSVLFLSHVCVVWVTSWSRPFGCTTLSHLAFCEWTRMWCWRAHLSRLSMAVTVLGVYLNPRCSPGCHG